MDELESPEIQELENENEERGLSVYSPLHRYLMEVRKYPLLSWPEEKQLTMLARSAGDDPEEEALKAITALVLSHLRLAASIAMEYKHLPFDIMDLIQEGNIGLMQAIKKFDPNREVRVATYATWWIRAYILKYILQNWRLVRIGTTEAQRKLFFNLSKERERLEKEGYVVGPKLLADHLHVHERDVIDVEKRLGWSQEVSLDQPREQERDGEGLTLQDQIASHGEGIEQQLAEEQIKALFKTKLTEFSQTLNPRDQEILSRRVLSETPVTLDALGAQYGISKERVRQLEENLIKRLKRFLTEHVKDFKEIVP